MKFYNWNLDKNDTLAKERGVSFIDIVYYIERGHVIDIVEHPNRDKYKNQKIYVIDIDDYIYLVPFIETEEEIFLKTIIPSRKATREYLRGKK
ncbi:MAG TPA: toxin [Spirochaetota bacterium]|nr:toxin [Spirochaetota bacterium]HRZ27351.1 toxin [Spirochaetota bacterium]HSA14285.1 toxin [Spirochaetota bacterium]